MTKADVALVISGLAGVAGAYGAVTGHRSLRWQKRRDAERRKVRAGITVEHTAWAEPASEGVLAMLGGEENLPLEYLLVVTVTNLSETTTVYVRAVLLEEVGGDGRLLLRGDDPDARDLPLKPGEPLVRYAYGERLGFDTSRGFIAAVCLAPNDWHRSDVEHLDPAVVEQVAIRNRRGQLSAPPDEP
jgi:hypothetical protein